jgi:hypothetical protein
MALSRTWFNRTIVLAILILLCLLDAARSGPLNVTPAAAQANLPTVVATDTTWQVDDGAAAVTVSPSCIPAPPLWNPSWYPASQLAPAVWVWSQSCTAGHSESHVFSKTFTAAPTRFPRRSLRCWSMTMPM